MVGKVFQDYARLFDHDVQECAVCQPKNDHFLDEPCHLCGHTWDDGAVTYWEDERGLNFKYEFAICHRCRIVSLTNVGHSVLDHAETGPGDSLNGYWVVDSCARCNALQVFVPGLGFVLEHECPSRTWQ